MFQWWYGHNAVLVSSLTAGFLAIMHLLHSQRAERPVYIVPGAIDHPLSGRSSSSAIWAGPYYHLHYTALRGLGAAHTVGMTFSIMLWMPSWGGMINGLMTLSGCVGQAAD